MEQGRLVLRSMIFWNPLSTWCLWGWLCMYSLRNNALWHQLLIFASSDGGPGSPVSTDLTGSLVPASTRADIFWRMCLPCQKPKKLPKGGGGKFYFTSNLSFFVLCAIFIEVYWGGYQGGGDNTPTFKFKWAISITWGFQKLKFKFCVILWIASSKAKSAGKSNQSAMCLMQ